MHNGCRYALDPRLPTSRSGIASADHDHPAYLRRLDKHHDVRESPNELSANHAVLDCDERSGHEPLLRLYPSQDAIDLLDELEAEADLLLLVAAASNACWATRSILKLLTSVADGPLPPLAERSRRLRRETTLDLGGRALRSHGERSPP